MNQTPSTCPAPRTASAELLTALSQGRPIAMAPGSAPSTSSAELHAVADELRSGATVLMPPATPGGPGNPAAPTATAPKVLREVTVGCRCEQYLKGEPAPTEPLALIRMSPTEADVVEHLHRATCYREAMELRMEDGEVDAAIVGAAYDRQRKIAQYLAERWGVALIVEHTS